MSVYFMQPTSGGPVKIGRSDDVDRRRSELEGYYGQSLAILATMDGGKVKEREIHARFAHLRIKRTEQFRPGPDLMAFIRRPLLVTADPNAVEAMEPVNLIGIITLRGSRAYAEWFEEWHRETHIPKATLVRLALAEWAKEMGIEPPPEF